MGTGTKLIRAELEILKTRINKEPRKYIQVIYGPRQTGKTTLLNQFSKRTNLPIHFATVDQSSAYEGSWINRQWEIARQKVKQDQTHEAILIIDDIQLIKNWGEQVKKEWDADANARLKLKVIIAGSSAMLLQEDLSDGPKNRFQKIYSAHWTFAEMNAAFGYNPEEYAWFGGYPGAATFLHDEIQWKNYVRESLIESTIHKDILMLNRVDKPVLLKRLFELGCQHSGQALSYTKIMGQLHDAGNTTTLTHYLSLLNAAGLVTGIEKYDHSAARQRGSIPKFQVYNTAFISATQQENFSAIYADPAKWGRWIESCIGAHLINACLKNQFTLHYWKHVNDEIDFVVSDGKKTIGIEVNSPCKQRRSGIKAFTKTHHPDKVLIVGTGGMSWQEFIKTDPGTLF